MSVIAENTVFWEHPSEKMNWSYSENNRIGDHIWWISDVGKFKRHYPEWDSHYIFLEILKAIYKSFSDQIEV